MKSSISLVLSGLVNPLSENSKCCADIELPSSLQEICVEIDEAVEVNELAAEKCSGLHHGISSDAVPKVGMTFLSSDEAFEYYKQYAYNVGFPIRRRSSKKDCDGLCRYVVFACSREGRKTSSNSNSLKPRPSMQTGCGAKLAASLEVSGIWRVTQVNFEHNHLTSPSKSRMYRCNRKLSGHLKKKLEVNDIAGIPLHKTFNSAVVEAGGYDQLPFIEKDCRNYIDKVRRLRLGEGDAAAIQAYFLKMQAQCPGFFFCLDLDDDSRLRNVFWADNRCRLAYKEFGDAVTFDTTYLTNRYDMPFAPFVGVNHHGQSTLLGCGLLSSEDTRTFVWLFNTWLQCMDGEAPIGIITDQDKAMQNAIQIVFPNTKHRWCLWHILKKIPEKFGNHARKGAILSALHDVIYESQWPEVFESSWADMIEKFMLHDNEWLSGLYKERARWVPCFLKISFWAGMSTTQRSESMNSFFDGYLHSKTSLKQFVEQYERALRCKMEKEFKADFSSYAQMVPCATRFAIGKQFQDVYTLSKFKEFQEELTGKLYCDLISSKDDYPRTIYEVGEIIILEGMEKKKNFTVMFEGVGCHITCSCHLFEFKGIICRHALSILIKNGVKTVPDMYILKRWRKDVRRAYTRVKINYAGWVSTDEQIRYDKLCTSFANLANIVADDEGRSREVLEWVEHQINHPSPSKLITCSDGDFLSHGGAPIASTTLILDPNCSKRKGAPRKLRHKGPLEKASKSTKSRTKKNKGNEQIEVIAKSTQSLECS